MNWGSKLIFSMLLFMVFIITLGVYMLNSSNELVTEDYYEQDLAFQHKIDAKKTAFEIGDKIDFKLDSLKQIGILTVHDSVPIEGKIHFMKPDDKSKDFKLDIQLDKNYQQIIPVGALPKGNWRITISGEKQTQKFEKELKIFL
jgi:nitrogen fixation protein FixH